MPIPNTAQRNSPFVGAFQPNLRPTVVHAPDALVYINGELGVPGCPDCKRTFDFNKYITSITVDLNIDSAPGSASISLAVPRHTIDDFYFDGNPIVTPMMEVEIYAKGYYLLEGIPQYYPIFWGLITEVSDNYSGGAHTVSIACSDILKWWELCKMNVNPALTAPGAKSLSLFQNTYSGMNPFDIIFSLAEQSFGDVIVGTGSLITSYREQNQTATFDVALSDICLYWQQRFSKIRNGLLLYGTNGVAVRGDTLESTYQRLATTATGTKPNLWVANAVRVANGGPDAGEMVYDPYGPNTVAFRNNYSGIGVNLWQSEFQSKLELAQAAKESIGYEFFMDVDGSIVFKPPFYNLDVLSNKPISWIQDIDIIDWDFSESEAEVVTQIILQGSFAGAIDLGVSTELTPFSSVTDYHLLRKYGWRSQTYNSEFLGDPQLMFYQGLDVLDRLNSRRHRGTVNIPLRPELRLGFPVYVAPKDQVWYVQGISHSINFGGRAQTTLTLTAKRTKFIGIRGITTLTLQPPAAMPATAATAPGTTAAGPGNSTSAGNALPSTAFPYSSAQLSSSASFTLNLGTHPAYLPALNTPDSVTAADGINPYQAIILRHPTTGRIMGAPNVVMVYTGSFASAATYQNNYQGNVGQTTPPSPASQKTQTQKITNNQTIAFANRQAVGIDDTASQLREEQIVNRYTYGLTSAGRFLYAYDTSTAPGSSGSSTGVIGEILTLPANNITVSPTPQDSNSLFKKGTTALIRPVSDERGFEVVGHFKYGRRVSLRDGSLVLTGNTNTATNIDMQLSLGGNLYDTLMTQSQGITAISAAYPNPAQTIATLQPTDLQTAAVIQPDSQVQVPDTSSGNQLLGPSGYNALGYPQQQGSPASVEATQTSRALTLAEMDIQASGTDPADPNDAKCPCLLSRSDLAFLNTGYTVQGAQDIVGTSSPDFTTLGNSVPGGSVTATLGTSTNPSPMQQQLSNQTALVQSLQSQLNSAMSTASTVDQVSNPVGWSAAQQTVTTLQGQLSDAMDMQSDLEGMVQTLQSAPGQSTDGTTPAPSTNSTLAKAEQYLVNLYQALDGPHQQYEQALRGTAGPGAAVTQPPDYLSQTPTSAPSLAAPFSPTTGAAIGNPVAAALTADSAVDNISQTWSQFGQQLQSTAQRATVQGKISQAQSQLSTVQAQIAALQAHSAGTTIVVGNQSPQSQLASLQQQAAKLQQQISDLQLQLAQLPTPTTT